MKKYLIPILLVALVGCHRAPQFTVDGVIVDASGEKLYLELKARGVLVRHFTAERIKDFNRITIGTSEQMETFINTLKEVLL